MEGTPVISESEAVAHLAKLAVAERYDTANKATVNMGPFTAYTLISAIQLVMRHPELSGPTAGILTEIRDQLLTLFDGDGITREILAMGMDPDCDVPVADYADQAHPDVIRCPECGGGKWHQEDNPDDDAADDGESLVSCLGCGYSANLASMIGDMITNGQVPRTIPYQAGAGTRDFSCPVCGGGEWYTGEVPGDMEAVRCAGCKTIYSREVISDLAGKLSAQQP
jgi:hypothetical protein